MTRQCWRRMLDFLFYCFLGILFTYIILLVLILMGDCDLYLQFASKFGKKPSKHFNFLKQICHRIIIFFVYRSLDLPNPQCATSSHNIKGRGILKEWEECKITCLCRLLFQTFNEMYKSFQVHWKEKLFGSQGLRVELVNVWHMSLRKQDVNFVCRLAENRNWTELKNNAFVSSIYVWQSEWFDLLCQVQYRSDPT